MTASVDEKENPDCNRNNDDEDCTGNTCNKSITGDSLCLHQVIHISDLQMTA